MTEAEWVALADVVDVGKHLRLPYALEQCAIALRLQRRLELPGPVEVVLERALVAPGDEQDVVETRGHRFLDDVLDGRLVDDRQHLLGRSLRRR